jgi:hypothetical protein
MNMVKNATVLEFLNELEVVYKELADEFRKITPKIISIRSGIDNWSFLETAEHIAPVVRFWIIWIHRTRGSLEAAHITQPAKDTRQEFLFNHPDPTGISIPALQDILVQLKQATNELIELLGWITEKEYLSLVPEISEEDRTLLFETPPGHYYKLSLPEADRHAGFSRLLEYAGGFSIKGMCGHLLEGHTRNHIAQMKEARLKAEDFQ